MKKLAYLLLIVVAVFFASCSSCSHKEEANPDDLSVPTEFEKSLTVADTNAVKEVIGKFINHIQKAEYYDAAAMVYRQEKKGEQITPRQLNNDEIERLVNVYKLFPVEDYKIDYMRFREVGLNEVCVSIIMSKGENGKPDHTSKMFFNPIYYQNQWCLVLDDSHAGTNTFVPKEKRDSMENVYKQSGSYKADNAKAPAPKKAEGSK